MNMNDVDYKLLDQRIRALRLKRGLTQEVLAEMVGCSNNHLSHIENASCKVSLNMLVSIAKVLNVSLDYFFFDTPFARPEAVINTEIAEKLNRLSPAGLATANKMLKSLIELEDTLTDQA